MKLLTRSARFKHLNKSSPQNDMLGTTLSVNISSDVSNDDDVPNSAACPLSSFGVGAIDCWMNLRQPDACPPDPSSWFISIKNRACESRGGTVGKLPTNVNLCYLPCNSDYTTFDFTCSKLDIWKSECVYWDWGLFSYWTGCWQPDTYNRSIEYLWNSLTEDYIKDKWSSTNCKTKYYNINRTPGKNL